MAQYTKTDWLSKYGNITAYGSPLWKPGLDVDLRKGDPVASPKSGKVVFAGKNGGFGNQVVVEDVRGNRVMMSHLDGINVKVGDSVSANQAVGIGGNTGSVIAGKGGDGSHLDVTIKKKDGSYYTAEQVEKYVSYEPLSSEPITSEKPTVSAQSLLDSIKAKVATRRASAATYELPKAQTKPQSVIDATDLDVKIDQARRQGKTDTDILNYLSASDSNVAGKISQARQGKNDRDILNYLSTRATGKMPTVKSNPMQQLPTTPLSKAAATTPFLGNKNQGLINAMKPEAQQAMISGRTAPSSTEAPKFFPGNGTLSNIGNALVSSERAFGDTLGQSVAAISGTGKTIEKASQSYMDTGNKWVQMMKNTTDPDRRAKYLKLANDNFAKAGSTYKAVLPAIGKTNTQILGEGAGVAFDVLTAGSYGKAAAGMKTGQLAKAGSTVGKTAPGLLGKIVKPGSTVGNATVKIASSPIPSAIKNVLKPGSVIKGVAKGAVEGSILNGTYGAIGAMQKGTDISQGAKSGAISGALFGGALGGVASKTLKTADKIDNRLNGKLGAADTLGSQGKLAQNLNKIIEFSPATTRKISKVAKEQGTDIGAELAKRKILPKVENERMLFDSSHLYDIEREITEKSKAIDEAVSLYKTEIPASDLVKKASQKIKSNQTFANEGRVDEITQKAISKIEDFVKQTGKTSFTLSDLQNFKKGMWSASKKFKMTEIGNADAYSELGHVFKTIIEDEIPDAAIKKINKEIGSLENVSKFLSATDKAGGIVLKGGKIGKYASGLTGSIIGAAGGGIVGGPVGAALGVAVGNAASGSIRKLLQKKSILGIVDRALLKLSKKSSGSQDIAAAMKFIADTKAGKNVTITPRVQKVISEILKSEYGIGAKTPLMLPAGTGLKSSISSGKTIKLPEKIQSTIIKNTETGISPAGEFAKQIKNMSSVEYQNAVRDILAKKESGKPLTRIEKAIEDMKRAKGKKDKLAGVRTKTEMIRKNYKGDDTEEMLTSEEFAKAQKIFGDIDAKKNTLIQEAKKYKSAEEFVKGQINAYHGTNKTFSSFDLTKGERTGSFGSKNTVDNQAIFLSSNKDVANFYGKNRAYVQGGNSRMIEANIPKEGILDLSDSIPTDIKNKALDLIQKWEGGAKKSSIPISRQTWLIDQPEFVKLLKDNGYKGAKFNEGAVLKSDKYILKTKGGNYTTAIFNPKDISTKSQLIDIWNKARGDKLANVRTKK